MMSRSETNVPTKSYPYNEDIDFSILHDPECFEPTECGICYCCIQQRFGECQCPQVPGTYEKWYNNKRKHQLADSGFYVPFSDKEKKEMKGKWDKVICRATLEEVLSVRENIETAENDMKDLISKMESL